MINENQAVIFRQPGKTNYETIISIVNKEIVH